MYLFICSVSNWQRLRGSQQVASAFFSSLRPALELRAPLECVNEFLSSERFWNQLNTQRRLRTLSSKRGEGGGGFEVDVGSYLRVGERSQAGHRTLHLKLMPWKHTVPVTFFFFFFTAG